MKAIAFDTFGESQVLQVRELPTPTAGSGEVLIRIKHTSVNPVDWKIRQGYLKEMFPHAFPVIPGWDVAGEIVELGNGVRGFSPGESVYAYARLPEVGRGTYAEYVSLPAEMVARAPASVPSAEAAAVPLVALTAWQGLHEFAGLSSGEHVLVTAGSGGVGSFAVQFAKLAGARVCATAGPANQCYLTELGADVAVDYTKPHYVEALRAAAPEGFDVVFDAVGGDSLKQAEGLVRNGGRLLSIVETPDTEGLAGRNVKAGFHFVFPDGPRLRAIAELIDAKRLRLPAIQVRSVREAAAAQDENEKRHVRGKLVLAIDF